MVKLGGGGTMGADSDSEGEEFPEDQEEELYEEVVRI